MKSNLNLDLNLDLKMKFSKLLKYVFTLQSKRSLQTYCSLDLPAITIALRSSHEFHIGLLSIPCTKS